MIAAIRTKSRLFQYSALLSVQDAPRRVDARAALFNVMRREFE